MLIRLRWDLLAKLRANEEISGADALAALRGHASYWQKRRDEGRALFAGGMDGSRWDDVAFIVFEASSEDEAKSIVQNDPAVKAHVFQAEVRPFTVHFTTTKHCPSS